MTEMMRRRNRFVFLCAALLLLAAGFYATRRHWLWLPLNPRYTEAELVGLSKQEVIDLLGKPYIDLRAINPDGPDCFAYRGAMGIGIAIDFDESGRAIRVRDASK